MMEKVAGIHRERNLPKFHSPTYSTWHARNAQSATADAGDKKTVAMFGTCIVEYNEPDVGVATTQVLERNGRRVVHAYAGCCGMPWLDGGAVDKAADAAAANVRALAPLAKAGLPILVPQPTCGYVLRNEYPLLVEGDDAKAVAAATVDVCEYLLKLHRKRELDTGFVQPLGKVAYHAPCHLRAQNVGLPARELLQAVPGTEVETVERCSAFDGTWGMKTQYYQLSRKYAGKLTRAIDEAHAVRIASDCRLAGLNVTQELGRTPAHPVQLLRDAYGMPPAYAPSPSYEQRALPPANPTTPEEK
jgi:glycerol-3-phosphate dehydrogenase subunit C